MISKKGGKQRSGISALPQRLSYNPKKKESFYFRISKTIDFSLLK
jgi:hypothetical protein